MSVFFMASLVITSKKELNYFVSNQVYLIVLFAFAISILGLLDLLNIFSYNSFLPVNETVSSSSDSISIDNNFALLPVFFGFTSILYFLRNKCSRFEIFYYNILLIIFSFYIILSGSRRGLFTFIAIIIILLVAQIFTFLKTNEFLKRLGTDSRYFLISFLLLASVASFVAFKTTYTFKIKMLNLIGSQNLPDTKQKIALKMFKYVSITRDHRSFPEFYSSLWPIIPEDPDSGWGTRVHKTVFPLTGENVEIVPVGSKGYLLDSTCNTGYYSSLDITETYTLIKSFSVTKGDVYKASVYCFVSDSFNLDVSALSVKYSTINDNTVAGSPRAFYDLKRKELWQKLDIEFKCNKNAEEVPVFITCYKKGIKDFKKQKGYVIFAYPTYEKLVTKDNTSNFGISQPIFYYKELIDKTLVNEVNNQRKNVILFAHIYKPNFIAFDGSRKYSVSSMFPISFLTAQELIQKDPDPIRNWASGFISEDTTYYPYKSKIVLSKIANSFIGERILRWEFAIKIFSKEYTWKQKIFGGGFNFLNWFGYYFDKDKTRSDYPHNPFLSILLYSGIFGLIIYLIFMYKVFYYYAKYFKEYKILAVFFIITFFFSFFSAGSPFDPPIMGFFVILPFFIHSVHKKSI